jgi:hypothetical protein
MSLTCCECLHCLFSRVNKLMLCCLKKCFCVYLVASVVTKGRFTLQKLEGAYLCSGVHKLTQLYFFLCPPIDRLADFWLLLRGSIVHSVPCTATIFSSIVHPHLSSNHSWFIHQGSLVIAVTPSSEAGIWVQVYLNLVDEVFLSYSAGIFDMP